MESDDDVPRQTGLDALALCECQMQLWFGGSMVIGKAIGAGFLLSIKIMPQNAWYDI